MANRIRWYKRDPLAALEGMSVLTLEERGAFNTLLDLIYAHDGSIDDDDRFIAGWLRTDVRVWRRIRARLLDLGKLYLHAGKLRNERADREVDAALSRVASAAQAGLASAAKREADKKIIKRLAATDVQRTSQLPTTTSTKITSSSSEAARARTPVASNWQQSRDDFRAARAHFKASLDGEPAQQTSEKRPDLLSRSELENSFEKRKRRQPANSTGEDAA